MFFSRHAVSTECESYIQQIKDLYISELKTLNDLGAKFTIKTLFYADGKFKRKPNKNCIIKLRVSIFPGYYSENISKQKKLCQVFYSNIGRCININNDYLYFFNLKKDQSLLRFLKKYINKIIQNSLEPALREKKSDFFRYIYYINRYGSDVKYFISLKISCTILVLILIVLLIFRLLIPSGYHPSIYY